MKDGGSNTGSSHAGRSKARTRGVHSTLFGFNGKTTMAFYVPKLNKAVVMLLTLHYDKATANDEKHKPVIISDYYSTNEAVDSLDKLCSQYVLYLERNTSMAIINVVYSSRHINSQQFCYMVRSLSAMECTHSNSRCRDRRRLCSIIDLGKITCLLQDWKLDSSH
jgi:hypothetical protein